MDFQVNLNICRVCMKGEEVQSLLRGDLHRKFEFATRLELNPHDNMPKNICTNCMMRLKVAYDFIQLAHTSEENLKAFLAKINNDFQMVTQTTPVDDSSDQQPEETEEEEGDVLIFLDKETSSENVPNSLDDMEEFISEKKLRNSLLVPVKKNVSRSFLINDSDEHVEAQKCVVSVKDDESTETTGGDFLVFDSEGSESVKTTAEAKFVYDENINFKEVYMSEIPEPDEVGSDTEMEVLEEVLPLTTEPTTDCQRTNMELQSPQGNDLKEFVVMLSDNEDESNSGSNSIKEEILWVKETVDENSVEELQIYEDTENLQEREECTTESSQLIPVTDTVVVDNENPILRQPELKSKLNKSLSSTTKSTKAKKQSSVLDNTRFYCLKCNRDFSTKTNLTRHMVTHDGTRPYVCKICGNSFTQNGTLKQHMYIHTGEKPFVCKYCDRGFTQCKSLVFHMRRHTGDKPFHCEHCKLFFRQKDGLKVHILKHHMITKQNGDSQTHTCIICQMVLSTKDELLVHMKKHLNTKRPNSKTKTGNADIILELMEESDLLDDKQLIKEDDETIVDDEELSEHIDATTQVDIASSSTDEPRRVKKYLCQKCFKCFAIKKNLIRHLSIHDMAVSELFQCETCEIAFDTSYALKTHCLDEHKNSKSNRNHCEDCNMDFLTADELNEHMISAHSELDYFCPICENVKFKSEKLLIDHMMMIHELTDGEEAAAESVVGAP